MSCIIDGKLYLCGIDELTKDFIIQNKIMTVFNVAKECSDIEFTDYHLDTYKYDIIDTFRSIYYLIKDLIAEVDKQIKKGAVVIHCQVGVSRSATMVLAYLMCTNKWTLCHAISYVKDRRPHIKPNPTFVKDLMRLEYEILETESFQFIYDEYAIDYILCYTNLEMKEIRHVREIYYYCNRDIVKTLESLYTEMYCN
jgi:hypothetical protein